MVTAGTSGAFVAIVYILTDVLQHRTFLKMSQPFVWLGLNSMTGDLHTFLCQHGSCTQELVHQACPGFTLLSTECTCCKRFNDQTLLWASGKSLVTPLSWYVNRVGAFDSKAMLAVYVGDEILERALPLVYWGRRGNNLLGLIQWVFHVIVGDGWFCSLAMALADVALWIAVAGLLYRRKWYLKV